LKGKTHRFLTPFFPELDEHVVAFAEVEVEPSLVGEEFPTTLDRAHVRVVEIIV
jgi:hypothetical protein